MRTKISKIVRPKEVTITSHYPTVWNTSGSDFIKECAFIFISAAATGAATWWGWQHGRDVADEHGFSPDSPAGPTDEKYIQMMFQLPIMSTAFNLSIQTIVLGRRAVYFFIDTKLPKPSMLTDTTRSYGSGVAAKEYNDHIKVKTLSNRQKWWQGLTTFFWDAIPAATVCSTSILVAIIYNLLALLDPNDDEIQDLDYQYNRAVASTAAVMIAGALIAGKNYSTSGTYYEPLNDESGTVEVTTTITTDTGTSGNADEEEDTDPTLS